MSPFLYTALPALHKLDPHRCIQSVVSLKNVSVGRSFGFPLGARFLLHLERETAHDRPTNRQFCYTKILQFNVFELCCTLKITVWSHFFMLKNPEIVFTFLEVTYFKEGQFLLNPCLSKLIQCCYDMLNCIIDNWSWDKVPFKCFVINFSNIFFKTIDFLFC